MRDSIAFAASISSSQDAAEAAADVCREITDRLNASPDVGLLFVSRHFADAVDEIARIVRQRLGTARIVGCTGESIVGRGIEIENAPAVSLWCATMPDVSFVATSLQLEQTPDGPSIVGWSPDLPHTWSQDSLFILLADPFSFPADFLLQRLNEDHPGVSTVGGMASGGSRPGENRLVLGETIYSEGAVGMLINGAIQIRAVVSQGCRPIGKPLVITRAERNQIFELGGKPAFQQLEQLFATLPNHEKAMVQRGLHVGRVVSEYAEHFEQGDFLVRNVLGIDQGNGSIVIGDYVRPGQTVQFHLRDEQTADHDLRQLVSTLKPGDPSIPRGGLLFTCNGRGTRTFSDPNHDAAVIQDQLGEIPLAGFFAQGEFGPVAGKNFVHGFTASLALFEAPD